ncbi:hypothetical protein MKX03_003558, partial [Papaver bracteatum]
NSTGQRIGIHKNGGIKNGYGKNLRNNMVSGSTSTIFLIVDGQKLVASTGDFKDQLYSEKYQSAKEIK